MKPGNQWWFMVVLNGSDSHEATKVGLSSVSPHRMILPHIATMIVFFSHLDRKTVSKTSKMRVHDHGCSDASGGC